MHGAQQRYARCKRYGDLSARIRKLHVAHFHHSARRAAQPWCKSGYHRQPYCGGVRFIFYHDYLKQSVKYICIEQWRLCRLGAYLHHDPGKRQGDRTGRVQRLRQPGVRDHGRAGRRNFRAARHRSPRVQRLHADFAVPHDPGIRRLCRRVCLCRHRRHGCHMGFALHCARIRLLGLHGIAERHPERCHHADRTVCVLRLYVACADRASRKPCQPRGCL